ncbi:3-ketodihydrosphingosine reductase [Anaeramoeba ignava]|uniref:3-ketodihydrosphingosine reductase n=1 Tax=Anaeramoeba ignava TaxID=1746090 RepID=A0A9Q0R8Z0_ANAIG|nr:3-ketodihydrosphingosine reductase [Anaeramoeba ignava]
MSCIFCHIRSISENFFPSLSKLTNFQFSILLMSTVILYSLFSLYSLQRTWGNIINFESKHIIIYSNFPIIMQAIAKFAVQNGSNVTLISKNQTQLIQSKKFLLSYIAHENQIISTFLLDPQNFSQIQKSILDSIKTSGLPFLLFINSEENIDGKFQNQKISDFESQMNSNFFAIVNIIKAILPQMISFGLNKKKRSEKPKIILINSQTNSFTFNDSSSFCASKYAIKGLCDCLRNEFKAFNIDLHLFSTKKLSKFSSDQKIQQSKQESLQKRFIEAEKIWIISKKSYFN